MTEDEKVEPVTEIVSMESIYEGIIDKEMEECVNNALHKFLALDDRLRDADFETVDALRDYIRAEAVLSKAHRKFMTGDTTSSTERMWRHASLLKNTLRDEIFSRFKGKKAKKAEIDFANKVLIESGVIEPMTEVDILADKKD